MSLSSYLTIALSGTGAFVAFGIVCAWVFARLYCMPRRRPPATTPADDGLPFLPVKFSSCGISLRGWFIPVGVSSTPQATIIVAHGWSSNASEMLPVARQLHTAGLGVLLYDARGHGASGSDGPITIRTFADDMLAAVDFLQDLPGVDSSRLGVIGHSIGGASAILAASVERRIRAVVSTSAFADPVTLTRNVMRALHIPCGPFLWLVCRFIEHWLGTTMDDSSPRNRVRELTVPLLLIHGASDRFVPPSNMDALYARDGQDRTRTWLVPGRRHWDVILDPEYGARVIGFLREHLPQTMPEGHPRSRPSSPLLAVEATS
jgi:pimeloyl-ACP methyl ester carboxylesterase